jgi:hypothetical protein
MERLSGAFSAGFRYSMGGVPKRVVIGISERVLTLRPESSGKEDSRKLETFHWNSAGSQSRRVELDQQPEASLAWWMGNHPCEE